MKALIFAAGLGTRLKPLTDECPKALIPLCGRPMLELQLLHLYSFGFNDITINVHAFGEQIESFISDFKKSFKKEVPGGNLVIRISKEYDLLRETGGGILHARKMLEDRPFLVHNVDIFSNLNPLDFYRDALEQFKNDPSQIASIAVSRRVTERYLLFDKNDRLVAWENCKTGQVKSPYEDLKNLSVKELNDKGFQKFPFAGVHVISPKIFPLLKEYAESIGTEKFSIIDFYLSKAKDCTIKGVELKGLKMCDVGKIEHIAEAEEFVKNLIV